MSKPGGPWSQRLYPVSVVLSRWESLTFPGLDTNPLQVSAHLPTPDRMESWVNLGRKEGHTKIQIAAQPRWNWRPYGQKAEILITTAPTMPAPFGKSNYWKRTLKSCTFPWLWVTIIIWEEWCILSWLCWLILVTILTNPQGSICQWNSYTIEFGWSMKSSKKKLIKINQNAKINKLESCEGKWTEGLFNPILKTTLSLLKISRK